MIGHLKNVLATFGIKCVTKKMDLISAAGQLPPTECWPELWVVEDEKDRQGQSDSQENFGAPGFGQEDLGLQKLRMKRSKASSPSAGTAAAILPVP